MDRMDAVLKCAEQEFLQEFRKSICILQSEYEKEKYWKKVKEIIEEVAEVARVQEDNCYLGVLYLESSLLTKSYELLVVLMDKGLYLNEPLCERYWRPQLFFEEFEKNIEVVLKRVNKEFRHIQPFEIHAIKRKMVIYYYASIYKLLSDMNGIFHVTNNVTFFYGRYMGEAQIIKGCHG